ncbi:MAG TPA: DUF2970 domain-containing protein [Burkholderiales bacterium]
MTRAPGRGSKPGALRAFKTVLWAFFGVRRSGEHALDAAHLTPAQVIVAGIIGAALFVTTIILLVRFITR